MSIPTVRLHRVTPSWLQQRVSVILVQPSHPGNVGACARAMRVMGLRQLVLVSPVIQDVARHPEAIALCSGATDVLAAAREVADLDQALADVTLAVAISAEAREFGPGLLDPEQSARVMVDEIERDPSHRVALVFGPERTGLSIEDAGRCQLLCSIPGDPDYNSLNLSQAVQVLTYELRRTALRGVPSPEGGPAPVAEPGVPVPAAPTQYANRKQVQALYEHLERALVTIGYLDPAHPKKLMARLRRLFDRTRLEVDEVQLLRGLCKRMEKPNPASPP